MRGDNVDDHLLGDPVDLYAHARSRFNCSSISAADHLAGKLFRVAGALLRFQGPPSAAVRPTLSSTDGPSLRRCASLLETDSISLRKICGSKRRCHRSQDPAQWCPRPVLAGNRRGSDPRSATGGVDRRADRADRAQYGGARARLRWPDRSRSRQLAIGIDQRCTGAHDPAMPSTAQSKASRAIANSTANAVEVRETALAPLNSKKEDSKRADLRKRARHYLVSCASSRG